MASPSSHDGDTEGGAAARGDGVDRDGDRAGTGGLALSAAGGLVVAGFLLASLQPLAYPVCQPMVQVVRGWPSVVGQYLPLFAGVAGVLAGAGLSARAGGRRRRPLAAVAGLLGVAVVARLGLAAAVCGPGPLANLGTHGMDVAVLVATGGVLAAGGSYLHARV